MDEKVSHARSWMRPWGFFPIVLMRDGLWSGWLIGTLMALGILVKPAAVGSLGDDWRIPIATIVLMGVNGWILGLMEGMVLAFMAGWRPLSLLNVRHSTSLQWLIGGAWALMVFLIVIVTLEGSDGLVVGVSSVAFASLGAWLAYRGGMRAIRAYVALPVPRIPPNLVSLASVKLSLGFMLHGAKRSLLYVLGMASVLTALALATDSWLVALGVFAATIVTGLFIGGVAGWAFGFWCLLEPFPVTVDVWRRFVLWESGFFVSLLILSLVDTAKNIRDTIAVEAGLLIGSVGMIGSVAFEVQRWIKEPPESHVD